MSLNYSFIDTFKLFLNSFKYPIFYALIISISILMILIYKNRNKKIIKYIITAVNVLIIICVNYYYFSNLISFEFSNPINNIYFYFFNTFIYLVLFSISMYFLKIKKIYFIIYGLSLVNILYSLFMTHYVKNIVIITIGNIFPMIKFGNIIYIVFYVLLTKQVIDVIIKASFKGVK